MCNHIVKMVGITLNRKIKAPPTIYSGLPDTASFIVLLRSEGRVSEVLQQERDTAIECSLKCGGAFS